MMRREVPGVLSARYRSPQCRGGRAISAAGTGMCCVVRQEAVAGASSVTRDAAACGVEVFRRVVRQEAVAGASSCGAGAVRRRALGDSVAGVTLVTRWGMGLVWALGPVPGAELTR